MRTREEILEELEPQYVDRDHADGGGYLDTPDHHPAILEVLLDIRDLLTPPHRHALYYGKPVCDRPECKRIQPLPARGKTNPSKKK